MSLAQSRPAAPAEAPVRELVARGSVPTPLDHCLRLASALIVVLCALYLVRSSALAGVIQILGTPLMLWALLAALWGMVQTWLWWSYRPIAAVDVAAAPALTVVIPAYNEEAMIGHAIRSVLESDYPCDRLQLIVVDDGSRDETWRQMQEMADRHPGRVTCLRLAPNRGKREALAHGFRHATGEVVVTIDSDSLVERSTLRAMAAPFADKRVGAVAGKVSVLNRREGLIPRLLQVRYAITFDVLRAAQSRYRTVYCSPGALAAYRMSAVREALESWLSQRFLGAPCTHGEDRALTNAMFAAGLDSVYQRQAVVHTLAPTTYRQLCRMFLRWDRSHVREELRFLALLVRRPRPSRLIALMDLCVANLGYPIGYAALALVLCALPRHPDFFLAALAGIAPLALTSSLFYLASERSADFLYGVLYAYYAFFGLLWIFPYAVLTVRSRSWMTR